MPPLSEVRKRPARKLILKVRSRCTKIVHIKGDEVRHIAAIFSVKTEKFEASITILDKREWTQEEIAGLQKHIAGTYKVEPSQVVVSFNNEVSCFHPADSQTVQD